MPNRQTIAAYKRSSDQLLDAFLENAGLERTPAIDDLKKKRTYDCDLGPTLHAVSAAAVLFDNPDISKSELAQRAGDFYRKNYPSSEQDTHNDANTIGCTKGELPQTFSLTKEAGKALIDAGGLKQQDAAKAKKKESVVGQGELETKTPEEQQQSLLEKSPTSKAIKSLGVLVLNGIGYLTGQLAKSVDDSTATNAALPPKVSSKTATVNMDAYYSEAAVEKAYDEIANDPLSQKNLGTLTLGNDKNQFLQSRIDTVKYAEEHGTNDQQLQAKANAMEAFALAKQSGSLGGMSQDVMTGFTNIAASFSMDDANKALEGHLHKQGALQTLNLMQNSIRTSGQAVAGDPSSEPQQGIRYEPLHNETAQAIDALAVMQGQRA